MVSAAVPASRQVRLRRSRRRVTSNCGRAVLDTTFLNLAGAMALVAVVGRGIGWALDVWVRRAEPAPGRESLATPAH
ncbi:MAG: hypothetical protein PGN34_13210 [Methylobacterium frigidaeris]